MLIEKLNKSTIIDGETTYKNIQHIVTYIVDETSRKILQMHYDNNAHKPVGREGATGHDLVQGDLIADEVINNICPVIVDKGIARISVYTEEGGVYHFGREGSQGIFLIVDPLDGSKLLRKGAHFPRTSVSVAAGKLSEISDDNMYGLSSITVSCVQDIFARQRYSSKRGENFCTGFDIIGGRKNKLVTYNEDQNRISVESKYKLKDAILSIDLDNSDSTTGLYQRLEELSPLMKRASRQRREGSSVLDYTGVCNGSWDGFLSTSGRIKLHDLAAAQHLVSQAGGINILKPIGEGGKNRNILKYIFLDSSAEDSTNMMKKTKWKVVAAANPQIMKEIKQHFTL
jgi:fructose-1,6-bisphosphatase/inositol monophosphatase family enzyme